MFYSYVSLLESIAPQLLSPDFFVPILVQHHTGLEAFVDLTSGRGVGWLLWAFWMLGVYDT